MPKVSVIMSVHNAEMYINESINSVLGQTFKDFDFIICDDCSSDNSQNIIRNYMENDPRIRLVVNEKNLGLSASLNKCIELSDSDYIARMDADDICLIDRFEKQVKSLNDSPDVSFVCGHIYLIDDTGIWGERLQTLELTKENVFKFQPITHPTVMIRRETLLKVGGYTVASYTKRGQDFDLWCKLYYHGYYGKNINEVVLQYREDRAAYQRRRFKYRIDSYRMKMIWGKKLKFPIWYVYYAIKPIVVGLVPSIIMKMYHRNKYSQIKNYEDRLSR